MARTARSQPIGGMMKPARGQDGLEDHRGDRLRPLAHDGLAKLSGAPLHQLGVGAGAAVAKRMGRRDLGEAGNLEVGVRRRHVGQPADGERPRRRPVIAADERHDLVLLRLPLGQPVVPGDLHRALVGLGAAHREHRVAEVARRQRRELGGELGGRAIRELARRRVVGEAHRLLGDGLGDLPPAVPDVDDGEAGEGVHQLLALLRPEPDALGAIDDELLVGEPRVILRPVSPEIGDLLRVLHGHPPRVLPPDPMLARAARARRGRRQHVTPDARWSNTGDFLRPRLQHTRRWVLRCVSPNAQGGDRGLDGDRGSRADSRTCDWA